MGCFAHIASPSTSCPKQGPVVKLVSLNFSAAFDRINHRCVLYKLRSIGVRGQFLFRESNFVSDGRQYVR